MADAVPRPAPRSSRPRRRSSRSPWSVMRMCPTRPPAAPAVQQPAVDHRAAADPGRDGDEDQDCGRAPPRTATRPPRRSGVVLQQDRQGEARPAGCGAAAPRPARQRRGSIAIPAAESSGPARDAHAADGARAAADAVHHRADLAITAAVRRRPASAPREPHDRAGAVDQRRPHSAAEVDAEGRPASSSGHRAARRCAPRGPDRRRRASRAPRSGARRAQPRHGLLAGCRRRRPAPCRR